MKKMLSMGPIIKKIAPVLLVSAFLLPSPARAETKAGSVELSPFAGYSFFEHRQNLENSPVFGGRIGYNITNFLGIEATGEYTRSHVDNRATSFSREGQYTSPVDGVSITRYNLDLMYTFMPESKFNPFVVAGYGVTHLEPRINSKNMSTLNYGVGAKYWLAERVGLRVDVRDNMIFDAHIHNVETTLGVVLALGGKSAAAAPVVAPLPVPAAAPVDSDHDGVPDALDRCPGTPSGVAVDANGCPIDSDRDGVADYLDKCPNTPAGASVDKNGCPLDSDQDGIADYLDKCPGTPAGVAVDQNGCPLDADKDGVPDYLDKCPNTPAGAAVDKNGCLLDTDADGVPDYLDKCSSTPAGVAVDKNGCPVDSDQDGVPDYLDKCPRTPAGVKVDAKGCPEVVMTIEKKEAAAKRYCSKPAVLAINFDTNKTDIKPEYYDELKTVGDFLTYFPNAKGEIAGHADTVGTKAHNLTLSQARADSVRQYIAETFGTDSIRIGTKGYGFSKPVASNKTEAGRAKNRRIEANFTCE
jgi:OmpA-OmpF porin, OOP family